jgi:hypothetical protein
MAAFFTISHLGLVNKKIFKKFTSRNVQEALSIEAV